MRLAKVQRNQVLLVIRESGLNPTEFGIHRDEERSATYIKHEPSDSIFSISGAGTDLHNDFVVSDGEPRHEYPGSWDNTIVYLGDWLKQLKEDLETPDLWAELAGGENALGSPPTTASEKTPFSPEEREEIAQQLGELRAYAEKTYELSAEQLKALEGRLAYLEEATTRLSRSDWRAAAIGTLFELITSAVLPPEAGQTVFQNLLGALGHLFSDPPPGLPPGLG